VQFKWESPGQRYCSACRAARAQKKVSRYEEKTCPNCGKAFSQERGPGKTRRFCNRECDIAWWSAHRDSSNRKAYRSIECPVCGEAFRVYSGYSRKYCSRACAAAGQAAGLGKKPQQPWKPRNAITEEALRLREEGRTYQSIADELGLSINTVKAWGQRSGRGKYGGSVRRAAIAAARAAAQREACEQRHRRRAEPYEDIVEAGVDAEKREFFRLRREGLSYQAIADQIGRPVNTVKCWGIRYAGASNHRVMPIVQNAEEWKDALRQLANDGTAPKAPQRILLVCGISHVSHGLENLLAVIRYRLHADPLSGDLFVFCGSGHRSLIALEWDGNGVRISKRRTQRGVYPWPPKRLGPLMEISEEDFRLLLSYSPKKILTKNS
jgi:DNA-binding CsgD family transcriptional regulator/transposase